MNFTTPSNIQMFLNKTNLLVSELSLITMLINMIDGVIKNYCGWEIAAKEYTKIFDGNGKASLDLGIFPLNSVSSLTIDGTDYTANATLDGENGILLFPSSDGNLFSSGTSNVAVTFNAGYSVIPDDLAYAASWLVTINFSRIVNENIGVVSEEFKGIKAEYDKSDIPVMVKHVLDRYRYIRLY